MSTVDTVVGVLESVEPWQGILLIIVAFLLASVALQVWGDRLVRRITAEIPGEIDDIVLQGLHTALYLSVAVVGGYVGVIFYELQPRWQFTLRAVTVSLVVVIWVASLVRIGGRLSDKLTEEGYLDQQVVPIVHNVYTALVIAGGIFLILAVWKVNIAPLLASASVAGVVVGLAAREAIANFFGSIVLYLDQTYTVGDFVVLETGERGQVEDISIRSTVIRTRDDILVTVPNAKLNKNAIINESNPGRKRRITVPVGVAYGTDADAVEEILLDIADAEDGVLDSPSPRVRFQEFGGSALQFELWCWIPNPAMKPRVVHQLNKSIYERFRAEGIEIPFPQRDVSVSVDDSAVLTD